jgi:bla regulator protein blaR1
VGALLYLGLSNAVWAIVLAFFAVVGARLWRRRPAVVHALWLLVLLKLVTPSKGD